MLQQVHNGLIFGRRVRVLASEIAARLPENARVLDIGCGSGDMAVAVMRLRPDIQIAGIDVLVRPKTAIPVTKYDGYNIPFADNDFDAAMIVDVLHHTDDPQAVLREAARVARTVVVKDHLREGFAAYSTLRFMDWVGNAAHGVRLPYNYLSLREWRQIWNSLGLAANQFATRIALYPWPFSFLFGRKLHFVTSLQR